MSFALAAPSNRTIWRSAGGKAIKPGCCSPAMTARNDRSYSSKLRATSRSISNETF